MRKEGLQDGDVFSHDRADETVPRQACRSLTCWGRQMCSHTHTFTDSPGTLLSLLLWDMRYN